MSRLQDYAYTLAANEELPISQVGTVVRCVGSSEQFAIKIDDGQKIAVENGIGFRFREQFKRVTVINGASPQTVRLYVGSDDVEDSRQSGSVGATVASAGGLQTAADVNLAAAVATLITAANGNRQTLNLTNLTGAAIRVGDANIGANRGLYLAAGLSMTMPYFDGPIYGYSASGGAVAMMWTEN